jgi:hypothetical protein
MRQHTPTFSESSQEVFTRFPLGCPLTLAAAGAILFVLYLLEAHDRMTMTNLAPGVGGAVFVVGLVLLPFGIATRLKRRRPLEIRCPTCGTASREAPTAFEISRWPGERLVYVTCSVCNRNFTVDGYRPLV